MKLVIKPNETISVNQVIKRGSFPSNLRLKRIFNSDNLQAQFLPLEENDFRPFAGRCKGGKGKRIVMQKSMVQLLMEYNLTEVALKKCV